MDVNTTKNKKIDWYRTNEVYCTKQQKLCRLCGLSLPSGHQACSDQGMDSWFGDGYFLPLSFECSVGWCR